MLALGLAAGLPPKKILDLYETRGAFVFADSFVDNIFDLGNAIGAEYGNANLKEALAAILGEQKLDDLPRKVLISSFDLDNEATSTGAIRTWKPQFFQNFPGPDSDGDQLLDDVAVRTSAAPSYFPVYQGFIDGGVVANNPSMCALAQALDQDTGQQSLENVVLLSISTGRNPVHLAGQSMDWGWVQWALEQRIINIMLEGNVGLADYQCERVLGDRYHRLDPVLPEPISLDDVGQVQRLKQIASEVDLTQTLGWMS